MKRLNRSSPFAQDVEYTRPLNRNLQHHTLKYNKIALNTGYTCMKLVHIVHPWGLKSLLLDMPFLLSGWVVEDVVILKSLLQHCGRFLPFRTRSSNFNQPTSTPRPRSSRVPFCLKGACIAAAYPNNGGFPCFCRGGGLIGQRRVSGVNAIWF